MDRSGRRSHQFLVVWFGRGRVVCGMGAALRLGDRPCSLGAQPCSLGALCPLWLSCPFWRIEDGAGTSCQWHPSRLGHAMLCHHSMSRHIFLPFVGYATSCGDALRVSSAVAPAPLQTLAGHGGDQHRSFSNCLVWAVLSLQQRTMDRPCTACLSEADTLEMSSLLCLD